jgi:preprotein translocase SecE subunit
MAVAVKKPPETRSSSLLGSLPVASLIGVLGTLACFAVVFHLLPALWRAFWESISGPPLVGGVLLGLLMLAGLAGYFYAGGRFLGSRLPAGTRAGVFAGLVGVLLVLLLTRWASLWIEYWAFYESAFGPRIGIILTAVVGGALLVGLAYLFIRPGFQKQLVGLERQGWFSAVAYKPQQGLRVRRGTILGILILAGSGIYTLMSRETLQRGAPDWELNIPFSGMVAITNPGDHKFDLEERGNPEELSRFAVRDLNEELSPARYVKVVSAGTSTEFKAGDIVTKESFDAEVKKLKEDVAETPPVGTAPAPIQGETSYRTLILLPAVVYSVPLLLLGLSLWLAWRVVNIPMFADFLIATEAEMNKVSWTTQKRLVQDTIVVLITTALLAVYLFGMDWTWRTVLSWEPIGVMRIPKEKSEKNQSYEERRW